MKSDTPEVLKTKHTLNHEYGHILQEQEMGTFKYFFIVAIPSVSFNYLSLNTKYHTEEYYYNLPWEYDADIRGGVTRDYHKSWAGNARDWYFNIWE